MRIRSQIFFLFTIGLCSCIHDAAKSSAVPDLNTQDDSANFVPVMAPVHQLVGAEIINGPISEPENWKGEWGSAVFEVHKNGILTIHKDQKIRTIKLLLPREAIIQRLNYLAQPDDLLLVFECTSSNDLYNKIFSISNTRSEVSWEKTLPTFNLTVGIIDTNYLYLGSSEAAYSLFKNSGKFRWQTLGLYEKHRIDHFDSIKVMQDKILLYGQKHIKNNLNKLGVIELDKNSGKFISFHFVAPIIK